MSKKRKPAIILRNPDGSVWAELHMRFDVEIIKPLELNKPMSDDPAQAIPPDLDKRLN